MRVIALQWYEYIFTSSDTYLTTQAKTRYKKWHATTCATGKRKKQNTSAICLLCVLITVHSDGQLATEGCISSHHREWLKASETSVCCCCFWKNPVFRQGLCYSYWSERSTLTAKIDLSPLIYCSVMLWYSLRLEIQYSHRTKKQSHDFGALVYFCSPTCCLNFLFPLYLFLGCMLCSRSSVGCFPLVLCPWLLHRR